MSWLNRMMIRGAAFGMLVYLIIVMLFETRIDEMSFLLRWLITYAFFAAGQLLESIVKNSKKKEGRGE